MSAPSNPPLTPAPAPLSPFRPDKRAWEARIRAALKPVPKRVPQLKNHY